ncbi:hypothetical protein [Chitinophaga ginsengisegetis]|uniref:hypothetical protein n=1 Tax=Chitinophaga ginsengisegetis TaxID=393003 RepID=UPI000DB9F9E8|nr:hypothetical protein [Chitinophaga ginsengisegetis]MDR6565439.1 hypothetical protein [Chitinophaga ginsengisegetis]MDR6645167.1 hypothetical protein [Chitinophaga ginsengisegetis]MDR6652241.1 hypothetical protein [Chitinophaga ginsengisegetis]
MQRTLLLLPVLILSCKQPATKTPQEAASVTETQAVPVPFTVISGNINSDSAVFEAAGITAAIANSGTGMQTIHITREGKRLINYMRAIDSTAKAIPVPQLIITGTDTVVGLSTAPAAARNIFFKIKNNKATYIKTGNSSKETAPDTIKKAPADAGAL